MTTTTYNSLREKIAAESAARRTRDAQFANLWIQANDEARFRVAGIAVKPMIVVGNNHATGEQERYFVEDGVCGFAYIKIAPATHTFARWLKKRGIGHRSYYGGWEISIREYGQSMQRKEEHARVVAELLVENGVPATHYSRMD